jgi:hypothetical protein
VLRGSEFTGAGVYFGLTLDSRVISSLLTAQRTEFSLSPGHHRIGVTCYAWFAWRGNELRSRFEQDTQRYFVLRGDLSSCAISELDPNSDELVELENGSLLVPIGTQGPP